MPTLLILLPLALLLILNLPLGKIARKSAFIIAGLLFLFQIFLSVYNLPIFWQQQVAAVDNFLRISFPLDYLSLVMLFSIGIVSLASLIVSHYTIEPESQKFNFINLLIIISMGMAGVVLVKDIFSLYIYLEITAIASFVLISFNKEGNALEGAFKYLIQSAIATVLMLAAIAFFFFKTGSTSFADIQNVLLHTQGNSLMLLAMGAFLCGVFIKGGLVPFHGWVPDAYSAAPASVSILLAGIVTKVSGIYTLIRIVTMVMVFSEPIKQIIMLVGAISIVIGAMATFKQNNFKRMLAYSSISQVGYIVLGFGVGSPLGLIGAVFHLFNHAIFKSLLFVNSAAVEKQTNTQEMDKLGGLGSRMPITSSTSVVGLLSTSGIPPLSGFWSKLIIIIALWQMHYRIYALVAVLFSVITLAYLLGMQRKLFFGKIMTGLEHIKEAGFGISFISIVLAVLNVGIGILFPFILNRFFIPIKDLLIK